MRLVTYTSQHEKVGSLYLNVPAAMEAVHTYRTITYVYESDDIRQQPGSSLSTLNTLSSQTSLSAHHCMVLV